MQTNMGMAGEFRAVVKRADGSTKIDTGYQKNLILNQGLDFFGGDNGTNMMEYCVIGSGNSQPVYTQNKLDAIVGRATGVGYSIKYDYDASRDGNLYKTNKVCKYSFTGLNNVNISELGLASTYDNTSNYYLCTRALIKDSQGNPTTITVLSGEILEIYYKLWAVFDTTDKTGIINLLDGVGGSTAYNYKTRLSDVGSGEYRIGFVVSLFGPARISAYLFDSSGVDLSAITTRPSGDSFSASDSSVQQYEKGSYKKFYTFIFDISAANANNRILLILLYGMCWQVRFGSVADDSPIVKNNTQTLSIPVEVSWGRYEGVL